MEQCPVPCSLAAHRDAAPVCFLFPEPFNTASPERQGAGLQHREDAAVEAMDRAALLPLLQAVPLLVTAPPRRCVQNAR
jgi:hypothetical protein